MIELIQKTLTALFHAEVLPSHDYLFELADKVSTLLENERASYRPLDQNGQPGAFLDFTKTEESLPLIIVPDLHARAYFLENILNYRLPEKFFSNTPTILEALSKKEIRIICVGDLLHSEMRGRDRWLLALEDFLEENYTGQAMTEEMQEGLTLLSAIMELKCTFPEGFHVLKGNHENIMNERGEGNFPFRKFADEGEMVFRFMQEYYGDDVLMVLSAFEKALPLLAAFPDCLISHAEPATNYSKERIINGMHDSELIKGLTWTPNDEAEQNSCSLMIEEFTGNKDALYFGGHRPIRGTCTYRQGGKYIQIHNPEREFITLLLPGRIFDPDTDIIDVENKS
ncbi:MAG: hypothetical protein K6F15_00355 [Treponema sp.]|nr:hypothetical protein [Treponema sp.]